MVMRGNFWDMSLTINQSAEKSFDFRLEFDTDRKQTVRLCLPSRHTVKSQAATPTVFQVSLIRPTT
jgi:hypothetical protein